MEKITAIVVTYNREVQLMDCLEAIRRQTLVPDELIIIDNHSKAETYQNLMNGGYIDALPRENLAENQVMFSTVQSHTDPTKILSVVYVRKFENDGGAGGFYEGMKQAYNRGALWLWMMDDDGVPDEEQLKELLKHSIENKLKYSNALVVSLNDNSKLAFGIAGYENVSDMPKSAILPTAVNPFNGTLIAREVITKVGLIKREMFIWGDETEYTNRVIKNGFITGTITSAKHKHPFIRGKKVNVIPGLKFKIVIKPTHFSKYYYRNLGYNITQYGLPKARNIQYYIYIIYFLTRFKFSELKKFHKFYMDGTAGVFDRR